MNTQLNSKSNFFSRVYTQFSKWVKHQSPWSLIWKFGLGLFAAGFLFLSSLSFLIWLEVLGPLPAYKELSGIKNHSASRVYCDDGKTQLGKYFIQNRTNVAYKDISVFLRKALVATEDRRFFEHKGIDFTSWFRVAFKTLLLRDESGGGGSTLSQQLAKNLFPRKKYYFFTMPINKIREMFVAARLETIYDKTDLITLYLNTVPFPDNIFGVEVAAERFYKKTSKTVNLDEAAMLIGMLKGPSYYHPVKHPERALTRRNTVLNQMYKYKYISEYDFNKYKRNPLSIKYQKEGHNEGSGTYFREVLRQELDELLSTTTKSDGTPYNLYTDGLIIQTTIDIGLQKAAEESVAAQMAVVQKSFDAQWKKGNPWGDYKTILTAIKNSPRYKNMIKQGYSHDQIIKVFEKPIPMTIFSWDGTLDKVMSPADSIRYYIKFLNAGFLAMDPMNGKVKAWVGGIDHKYFQYDHVRAKRQVGSTIKPILYTAALRHGFGPCSYWRDSIITYKEYENWRPENAGKTSGKFYSMRGALSESINTIAVQIIMDVGINEVVDLAKQMGLSGPIPKEPSIALGSLDASLSEMVTAYCTFANKGKKVTPYYLKTISNSKGEILFDFSKDRVEPEPILEEKQADLMLHMLKSVVDSGTAYRLRREINFPFEMAGKTGTTQKYSDGWFIGCMPNLVAGAWVGGEMPIIRFKNAQGQGSATALPIVGKFVYKTLTSNLTDPRYKSVHFSPIEDSIQSLLNCSMVLDSRPENKLYATDPLEEKEGIESFITSIFGKKDSIPKKNSKEKNNNPQEKRSLWDKIFNRN
jgi:penicillin-binding protein 1A